MVRLQLESLSLVITKHFTVSIPQWFDYNTYFSITTKIQLLMSQFHNGSITTTRTHESYLPSCGESQFHNGSITTFSSYNKSLYIFFESQFHNGSITTCFINQSRLLKQGLSQFHNGSITTITKK